MEEVETTQQAMVYLRANGFRKIGCGCESVVFSSDGADYVIKVTDNDSVFSTSGTKDEHIHMHDRGDFADTKVFRVHDKFFVTIQEKMDETVHSRIKRLNFMMKHGTIGIKRGNAMITTLARRCSRLVNKLEGRHNIGDLHRDNVGIVGNSLKVIDWAYEVW